MKRIYLLVFATLCLMIFSTGFAEWVQAADPIPGKGRTWTEPATGMEFVWIEGGCFWMGQNEGEKRFLILNVGQEDFEKFLSRELPRHEVCLDGFWMGKLEVANGEFRKYRPDHDSGSITVVKNPLDFFLALFSLKGFGPSVNGDRQPAVRVSWDEAMAFAGWLSGKNGWTFRLPTEAEWEYAARAGTETPFFWGTDPEEACRFGNVEDKTTTDVIGGTRPAFNCIDRYGEYAPVGSFAPNPWGLHDMAGNAKEWCLDWFAEDYYRHSPRHNPRGPENGDCRVRRDGGLWTYSWGVRTATRTCSSPDSKSDALGFRLMIEGKRRDGFYSN